MSREKIKYNLNEEKFNLKTIISIIVLIDLSFIWYIPTSIRLIVIGSEISYIIALLQGLRGQSRFRDSLFELRSILIDKDITHEMRGHRLEQQAYQTLLAYGCWFEEDLRRKGFDFKKKRKKNEVKKK